MNWVEGIVVYVLVWWVVIFAILPFWVRQQDEVPPGHAFGAPAHPHLWRKAAITGRAMRRRAQREKCKRDGAAAGEQRQAQIKKLMAENLALPRVIDTALRQHRSR